MKLSKNKSSDIDVVEKQLPMEVNLEVEGQKKGWFRRNRAKLAIGATALSLGTLAFNPLGDTAEKVKEVAPWVAPGMLVGEAMWIGGAAMMLAATGSEVGKNPLKIKDRIPEIAQKANNSNMFKAGFVINTVGAVGEFVIPAIAVTRELPVESWGILGFSLLDLGVTIAVRKAIYDGVAENSITLPESETI